jgi:hypothetical protein
MAGQALLESTIAARRGRPLTDYTAPAPSGQRSLGRAAAAGAPTAPGSAAGVWAPVVLTVNERYDLLDVWTTVFTDLYVHYDQKRALYGFDPLRALGALRRQIPYLDSAGFLRELVLLVNHLRDQHTQLYVRPAAPELADKVAILPFLIEPCGPHLTPTYLVTKITTRHPTFGAGCEVTTWNGVPIARAVDVYGETMTGGRPDARRARALETLTQRPLQYQPVPDERWVDIGYRTPDDPAGRRDRAIRFHWQVIEPDKAPSAAQSIRLTTHRAVNASAEVARRARKLLFQPALWQVDHANRAAAKAAGWLPTSFPDAVSARPITTTSGRFGYLRLWTFDIEHDHAYVAEVARLLARLPENGLIIDLRANPGGVIDAAERLLQLFTDRPIDPARFACRATATMADLADADANGPDLADWAPSTRTALMLGEAFSQHLPISDADACNDTGRRYHGPVVAVVDANTFSSGDLFTAGIVDHDIGTIVAIGNATGAGGANVWTSDDLAFAYQTAGRTFPPLPAGITFTVAMRRMVRTGTNAGLAIEDVGVPAHETYTMTSDDLLHGNGGLADFCGTLLAHARH